MPRPGDLAPGFTIEPGKCWRMTFNAKMQGSHCAALVAFRGRFKNHAGKVWMVDACEAHVDELTDVKAS
jgi:hypothetical protein